MIPKLLSITAAGLLIPMAITLSQTQNEKPNIMRTTDPQLETVADEAHSFAEYKAVSEALKPYIDSATTGDGEAGRATFFDHAHIVGSIGGEFYNMDADTFKGAVTEGGPSPDVQHHIAWIDISGPAAAAKVEFIDWSGHRFTDFFVLYKAEGQWKISGKVYDSHSKN